jgi:hypothetical protein
MVGRDPLNNVFVGRGHAENRNRFVQSLPCRQKFWGGTTGIKILSPVPFFLITNGNPDGKGIALRRRNNTRASAPTQKRLASPSQDLCLNLNSD